MSARVSIVKQAARSLARHETWPKRERERRSRARGVGFSLHWRALCALVASGPSWAHTHGHTHARTYAHSLALVRQPASQLACLLACWRRAQTNNSHSALVQWRHLAGGARVGCDKEPNSWRAPHPLHPSPPPHEPLPLAQVSTRCQRLALMATDKARRARRASLS